MDTFFDVVLNNQPWKSGQQTKYGLVFSLPLLTPDVKRVGRKKYEIFTEIEIRQALAKDPYVMLFDNSQYCSGLTSILVERLNIIELHIPKDAQYPMVTRYLRQLTSTRFSYIKARCMEDADFWEEMSPLATAMVTAIPPALYYNEPQNKQDFDTVLTFQKFATNDSVEKVLKLVKNSGGLFETAEAYRIYAKQEEASAYEEWTEKAYKTRFYFANRSVSLREKIKTLKQMCAGESPDYLLAPSHEDGGEDVDTNYLNRITPIIEDIHCFLNNNRWAEQWITKEKTMKSFLQVSHHEYNETVFFLEKLEDTLILQQEAIKELAEILEEELMALSGYNLWRTILSLYKGTQLDANLDFVEKILDSEMLKVWREIVPKKKYNEQVHQDMMNYIHIAPAEFARTFTVGKLRGLSNDVAILFDAYKKWIDKKYKLSKDMESALGNESEWCSLFIDYIDHKMEPHPEMDQSIVENYTENFDLFRWPDCGLKSYLNSIENFLPMDVENLKLNILFPTIFNEFMPWNHWTYEASDLRETTAFLNLWSRTIAVQEEMWPSIIKISEPTEWNEKVFNRRLDEWTRATFADCVKEQSWPGGSYENPQPALRFPLIEENFLSDNPSFALIVPFFMKKFNSKLHNPQAKVINQLDNARARFVKVVEMHAHQISNANTITDLFQTIAKLAVEPWQCLEFLSANNFFQNNYKVLSLLDVEDEIFRHALSETKHKVGFPNAEKRETIDETGLRSCENIKDVMCERAKILYDKYLKRGQKLARQKKDIQMIYEQKQIWTEIFLDEMYSFSRSEIKRAAKSIEIDNWDPTGNSILDMALDRLLLESTRIDGEILTWMREAYCEWTLYNTSNLENTFSDDVIYASLLATLGQDDDQKLLLEGTEEEIEIFSGVQFYHYFENIPSTNFNIGKKFKIEQKQDQINDSKTLQELILKPSKDRVISLETAKLLLTQPHHFLNTRVLPCLKVSKAPSCPRYCIDKNGFMYPLCKANTYWTPDIIKSLRDGHRWNGAYAARFLYEYKEPSQDEEEVVSLMENLFIHKKTSTNFPNGSDSILSQSPTSTPLTNIKYEVDESLKTAYMTLKPKKVERRKYLLVETTDLRAYVSYVNPLNIESL